MRRIVVLSLLVASCTSKPDAPADVWGPGRALPSVDEVRRELHDVRGIIHAHSVYSHDACDGEPMIDGVPNAPCLADLRRGICQTKHDFVMLTDHGTHFRDAEFPDVLLFDTSLGDRLVERNGEPVASMMSCDDREVLILAGTETSMMPVGLEGHLDDRSIYGAVTSTAVAALKARGAVVLLQHTEDWTPDQIIELGVDGFEMYNLHANTLSAAGTVLELLVRLDRGDDDLMASDLGFLPIVSEDPRYLDTWSKTLARGVKRVSTMGTDCHRNAFDVQMPDGERVDSYRRMMGWFSNHLLVTTPGDDRALKNALRMGRLYGAFEAFGYPMGFDYYATSGGEMGDVVSTGTELVVVPPTVRQLDASRTTPTISTILYRATDDGWSEIERSEGTLRHVTTEAGAYRAEVRIVPLHLLEDLGSYRRDAQSRSFVWIYANPIYVE